jgi:DNA polymerase III subunit gamma/tau
MSKYQILSRKFRPQTFDRVVAQDPIVATLKNAIQMQRTAHAYLFCGSRGTGKTTLARLFAKALNCAALSEDIEPCDQCTSCSEIRAGHSLDVLEIDGASHRGIEDIRQINENIGFSPAGRKYKIYLIDEVHMLTKEAFNALLKTLEEPPSHVKFFFCTTEPHRIPPTILSRCQRFNLRRIPLEKMEEKLSEIASKSGISIEKEALISIAELSEGSLRDALSLLDQVIAFEKGKIESRTLTEVLGLPSKDMFFFLDAAGSQHNMAAAFTIAGEVFESGKNLLYFIEELISHFRTLFLIKNGSSPLSQKHRESAEYYSSEQLMQILEILADGHQNIKTAPSERCALELLLLKILRTHHQISLESLVNRLISLEERLSISEDPQPKLEELPKSLRKDEKILTQSKSTPPAAVSPPLSIQEQSRFDTVMRFAAKELNGSLKKEG